MFNRTDDRPRFRPARATTELANANHSVLRHRHRYWQPSAAAGAGGAARNRGRRGNGGSASAAPLHRPPPGNLALRPSDARQFRRLLWGSLRRNDRSCPTFPTGHRGWVAREWDADGALHRRLPEHAGGRRRRRRAGGVRCPVASFGHRSRGCVSTRVAYRFAGLIQPFLSARARNGVSGGGDE